MPLNVPGPEYWQENPAVALSGIQGWNHLFHFNPMMHEAHPETAHLEFGFCVKEQIHKWMREDWIHARTEWWGDENRGDFNDSISLRYGMVDDNGVLMFQNSYVMVRDKDETKRIHDIRHQRSEDHYSKISQETSVHVPAEDPRFHELVDSELEAGKTGLETQTVTVGDPDKNAKVIQKRPRGRPRKNPV